MIAGRIALAPVALLAGCLLAPGRPAGGGGDDAGSGGSGYCPGAGDRFGAAVAFDRGSGTDSLYRVGVGSALGPFVVRLDDPTHLPACAADVAPLATTSELGAAITVDAITVVTVDDAVHAYVLAADATTGSAAIHDLVETAGHLVDTTTFSEPGLAPTPVLTTTGTDAPAFVTFVDPGVGQPRLVWFGGGSAIGVLDPQRLNAPSESDRAAPDSSDPTPYYGVAPVPGSSAYPSAVIGGHFVYDVEVAFGLSTPTTTDASQYENRTCSVGTTPCAPRIVKSVRLSGLGITAVMVDVAADVVQLVSSASAAVTVLQLGSNGGVSNPAGALLDADLDQFDGDKLDLVGLFAATGTGVEQLAIFEQIESGTGAVEVDPVASTTADRLVIARTPTTRGILVLADDVGVSACFAPVGEGTFGPCP